MTSSSSHSFREDPGQSAEKQSDRLGESSRNAIESLRNINVILQRRIQEAILNGALQQADDAVPPQYKAMVEDYYRSLSEDVE